MAEPLKIPATNIRVHQDHIGGGFGSKFSPDRWGIATAEVSKKAGGKPVRIMLERDSELKVAGARPSAYARVRVGAKRDGTIVAWQSESWGTGGPGGGGMPPIPYVFSIPNQRKEHTAIRNNIGPARAWRAPNHPQAAVITMCALDDLAAKLNMDPLDFFLKNIKESATGTMVKHTAPKRILGNLIPFPRDPKEQRAIISSLDDIREETQRLANLCERKLAALETLRKSLLHQAFTGKL